MHVGGRAGEGGRRGGQLSGGEGLEVSLKELELEFKMKALEAIAAKVIELAIEHKGRVPYD